MLNIYHRKRYVLGVFIDTGEAFDNTTFESISEAVKNFLKLCYRKIVKREKLKSRMGPLILHINLGFMLRGCPQGGS